MQVQYLGYFFLYEEEEKLSQEITVEKSHIVKEMGKKI